MKHLNSSMKKVLRGLKRAGFEIERRKKGLKIIGINGGPNRIMHPTENAFHPLRRWLRDNYNIDINKL